MAWKYSIGDFFQLYTLNVGVGSSESGIGLAADERHRAQDLVTIFDELFADDENTRLVAGQGEPLYLPAGTDCDHHRVVYAHGYFASALHEVAHWCIAGRERRLQVDYGYWYQPDGRTEQQQAEFERVEVKPQALEWVLSACAGYRFHLSADNTNAGAVAGESFRQAVADQAQLYCRQGLPVRAARLAKALQQRYLVAQLPVASFFVASKL